MDESEWFPHSAKLGDAELSFLAALRARAVVWPVSPLASAVAAAPDDGDTLLVAYVDIDDPAEGVVLLTVGVHMCESSAHGDILHNQLLTLPPEPTSLAIHASGSPEELADQVSYWFEGILRRPIVREEWRHEHTVYAYRYRFGDNGGSLVEMYNRRLAPANQKESINRSGTGQPAIGSLGSPDHIIPVSG